MFYSDSWCRNVSKSLSLKLLFWGLFGSLQELHGYISAASVKVNHKIIQ